MSTQANTTTKWGKLIKLFRIMDVGLFVIEEIAFTSLTVWALVVSFSASNAGVTDTQSCELLRIATFVKVLVLSNIILLIVLPAIFCCCCGCCCPCRECLGAVQCFVLLPIQTIFIYFLSIYPHVMCKNCLLGEEDHELYQLASLHLGRLELFLLVSIIVFSIHVFLRILFCCSIEILGCFNLRDILKRTYSQIANDPNFVTFIDFMKQNFGDEDWFQNLEGRLTEYVERIEVDEGGNVRIAEIRTMEGEVEEDYSTDLLVMTESDSDDDTTNQSLDDTTNESFDDISTSTDVADSELDELLES